MMMVNINIKENRGEEVVLMDASKNNLLKPLEAAKKQSFPFQLMR